MVSLTSIFAVLIALLSYAGGNAGEEARLEVTAEPADPRNGEQPVQVTLSNTGGSGAQDIIVEVRMGGEMREVTFTDVGKDEERSATVNFPAEASGPAEVEILSYNHP